MGCKNTKALLLSGGAFLNVTTYKRKNGFLLIEIFRKLFNPQNYGHQGSLLGGLFLYVRGSKNFAFRPIKTLSDNVGGLIRIHTL
jgi:hypothetical protein